MFDWAHYESEGILLPTPGDVGSYAICASEAFPSVEHTCDTWIKNYPDGKVKTKIVRRFLKKEDIYTTIDSYRNGKRLVIFF